MAECGKKRARDDDTRLPREIWNNVVQWLDGADARALGAVDRTTRADTRLAVWRQFTHMLTPRALEQLPPDAVAAIRKMRDVSGGSFARYVYDTKEEMSKDGRYAYTQLREVVLDVTQFQAEEVLAWSELQNVTSLRRLTIRDDAPWCGDRLLPMLVGLGLMSHVTELALAGLDLTRLPFEIGTPAMRHLEVLDISHNRLRSVLPLTSRAARGSLRRLVMRASLDAYLWGYQRARDMFAEMAVALTALESLDVSENPGVFRADTPLPRTLRTLVAESCALSLVPFDACDPGVLPQLERLYLANNPALLVDVDDDDGARCLAQLAGRGVRVIF